MLGDREGVRLGWFEGDLEGVKDGGREGVKLGTFEGDLEGVRDGEREGVRLGMFEGPLEGVKEGEREGALLGAFEGALEGEVEGRLVGYSVGCSEGLVGGLEEPVGELLGCRLGILVGPGVVSEGADVGAGEGNMVGSPLKRVGAPEVPVGEGVGLVV